MDQTLNFSNIHKKNLGFPLRGKAQVIIEQNLFNVLIISPTQYKINIHQQPSSSLINFYRFRQYL